MRIRNILYVTFFYICLINLNYSKAKDSDFHSIGFKPLKTAIKSKKLKKIRSWDEALKDYLNQN